MVEESHKFENKNERNAVNNNNTFAGKVALVTGATSGIGKATAIAFARAGAKVVVSGRREKEGTEVVRQIEKLGGDAHSSVLRSPKTRTSKQWSISPSRNSAD